MEIGPIFQHERAGGMTSSDGESKACDAADARSERHFVNSELIQHNCARHREGNAVSPILRAAHVRRSQAGRGGHAVKKTAKNDASFSARSERTVKGSFAHIFCEIIASLLPPPEHTPAHHNTSCWPHCAQPSPVSARAATIIIRLSHSILCAPCLVPSAHAPPTAAAAALSDSCAVAATAAALERPSSARARRRRPREEHKESDDYCSSESECDTRALAVGNDVARTPWATQPPRVRALTRPAAASASTPPSALRVGGAAPSPPAMPARAVETRGAGCAHAHASSSDGDGDGPNGRAPRVPQPLRDASFLRVGQTFAGSQTVTSAASKSCDEWRVNVVVQGADLDAGTICGSMEALDVPRADSPVLTFWRGQIVDNRNHFFRTARWRAEFPNDMDHWGKFRAFDADLAGAVKADRGDDIDLSQRRHVFMRWKEIFFVSPGEDCGLTIAGFYYCCMDRLTGSIAGYYFDPNNQPWQKLLLRAQPGAHGFAFADYDFN